MHMDSVAEGKAKQEDSRDAETTTVSAEEAAISVVDSVGAVSLAEASPSPRAATASSSEALLALDSRDSLCEALAAKVLARLEDSFKSLHDGQLALAKQLEAALDPSRPPRSALGGNADAQDSRVTRLPADGTSGVEEPDGHARRRSVLGLKTNGGLSGLNGRSPMFHKRQSSSSICEISEQGSKSADVLSNAMPVLFAPPSAAGPPTTDKRSSDGTICSRGRRPSRILQDEFVRLPHIDLYSLNALHTERILDSQKLCGKLEPAFPRLPTDCGCGSTSPRRSAAAVSSCQLDVHYSSSLREDSHTKDTLDHLPRPEEVHSSPGCDSPMESHRSSSSSQTSSGQGRFRHMLSLRREQERSLVKAQHSLKIHPARTLTDEPQPSMGSRPRASDLVLRVWGIIPAGAGACGHLHVGLVRLLALFCVAHSVMLVATEPAMIFENVATCAFALGAFLGHVSLSRVASLIGPHATALQQYAEENEFVEDWEQSSMRRLLAVAAIWLSAVSAQIVRSVCYRRTGLLSSLSFTYLSGLLAAVAFCQMHVQAGLELMLDCFCIGFYANPHCPMGVRAWNVLQAILRLAAGTVDSCFLAVQTSALAALLAVGVRVLDRSAARAADGSGDISREEAASTQVLECLPAVFLSLYALAVFVKAAAVTEKCCRVPSLVNSLDNATGDDLDHSRQYIVQYIKHSDAGFYVKGVRLTAYMVIKLSYVCGAIAFGLVTTFLSGSR